MIRRLWCGNCRTVADTVVINGKESCAICGEDIGYGSGFVCDPDTTYA